ncbi:hypothetical protein K491DRAFT_709505 [Lophiostoma macrostomum CBS 122681]|uniref:Uncharacterized protein n=1 Tax=Lophiostoma macrostomum CBS 122681 TaxID=1314788 RepID=A0A6A6TS14_9PLEO|nr:hypothetical protein K491DRAFT_709505 [Lophiostoma macrostomum CBS 122681]
MGAIRRPFLRDVTTISNHTSRSFHQSARLSEGGSNDPGPRSDASAPRQTLRTRSNAAFRKLDNLAGDAISTRTSPEQPSRPLIRRVVEERVQPNLSRPNPPGGPPGTMVRAPAQLRLSPAGPTGLRRGPPNARGRGGAPARDGQRQRSGENNPRRRERKPDAPNKKKGQTNQSVDATLNDGMVRNLLRLQRLEWDRVPYEPKYGQGSKAALDLVEEGKMMFAGQPPKTKKEPSRLHRTIGVVGMHGI